MTGQPAATVPATRSGENATDDSLLSVESLSVSVLDHEGRPGRALIRDVSLSVRRQEVVAIVGESGSGKSTLCYALVGLLADNLGISGGSVTLDGDELTTMNEAERRRVRGRRVGFVFQNPLAALNPVRRIFRQLVEARAIHRMGTKSAAKAWATAKLSELGFTDPDTVMRSYPNELSGGMRQRICIGIAVSGEPDLIVADEPTTALDVSLQGRLLELLLAEAQRSRSGLLLISHDIAVVRSVADTICIMYGGRMLERGPAQRVLAEPRSPYTRALLASLPTLSEESLGKPLVTIGGEFAEGTGDGCPFSARCPRAETRCALEFPDVSHGPDGQDYWCWNPEGTRS